MSNPAVWWSPDVPPEVKAAAEPIVHDFLPQLPTWVHELVVRWQSDVGDLAYADSDVGARRSRLTLTPGWLESSDEDRRDVLRHEFAHFLLHPLTNWTKGLISAHMPEDLQEWMLSEWQERLEGVTCDLVRILERP